MAVATLFDYRMPLALVKQAFKDNGILNAPQHECFASDQTTKAQM